MEVSGIQWTKWKLACAACLFIAVLHKFPAPCFTLAVSVGQIAALFLFADDQLLAIWAKHDIGQNFAVLEILNRIKTLQFDKWRWLSLLVTVWNQSRFFIPLCAILLKKGTRSCCRGSDQRQQRIISIVLRIVVHVIILFVSLVICVHKSSQSSNVFKDFVHIKVILSIEEYALKLARSKYAPGLKDAVHTIEVKIKPRRCGILLVAWCQLVSAFLYIITVLVVLPCLVHQYIALDTPNVREQMENRFCQKIEIKLPSSMSGIYHRDLSGALGPWGIEQYGYPRYISKNKQFGDFVFAYCGKAKHWSWQSVKEYTDGENRYDPCNSRGWHTVTSTDTRDILDLSQSEWVQVNSRLPNRIDISCGTEGYGW